MTLEAIVCKMKWILGITENPAEMTKLFLQPIDFDIF